MNFLKTISLVPLGVAFSVSGLQANEISSQQLDPLGDSVKQALAIKKTLLDAGWINAFEGTPDSYTLTREGKTVPVALLMVLKVGDEIAVNDHHAMALSLRGGMQSVKVTPANSPFKVDKASQVSEGALWTWIEAHLSKWRKLTQSEGAHDSTDTLQIPVLDKVKEPLTLVAGKRSLSVQWYGGTAPYQVLVKRRRKILESLTTEKTAIDTKAINFKRGKSYRVVVEDAQGQHFWGGFKAVSKAPPHPEVLQDVPDDIRPVLQATWLIFEANGKWIFEAYQQLGTSEPAQLLKTALAQGIGKRDHRGPSRRVKK
jgi:hypothetical protein